MSRPTVLYWPPSNDNSVAIAATQIISSDPGPSLSPYLKLNVTPTVYPGNTQINPQPIVLVPPISSGLPVNPLPPAAPVVGNVPGPADQAAILSTVNSPAIPQGSVYLPHMMRTLWFRSNNDTTGLIITVTGLSAPADGFIVNPATLSPLTVQSEVVAGATVGNILETANVYARVDYITLSGTVPVAGTTLGVGYGKKGYTNFVFLNYDSHAPMHVGLQGQPVTGAGSDGVLGYGFWGSLTKPDIINTQFGNLSPWPQPLPLFPIGNITNATDNMLTSNIYYDAATNDPLAIPFAIVCAGVEDTSTVGVNSFYFTVIQQGIK